MSLKVIVTKGIFKENKGHGIQIVKDGNVLYYNEAPAELWIQKTGGGVKKYRRGYDRVERLSDGYGCETRITTDAGSILFFKDTFAIDCKSNDIIVHRNVTVEKGVAADKGFSTEFGLCCQMQDNEGFAGTCEVFVPGIWYKQNKGVVKNAFAPDMYQKSYYFRITRMALPYIQLCNRKTGEYISFCHELPIPEPGLPEENDSCIIAGDLRYGSLGITVDANPAIKYAFPGSEGTVNYINCATAWTRRLHPVRKSVGHEYQFRICSGVGADSYVRMRNVWRHWYQFYQPKLYSCDLDKVYQDGIEVIQTYCQEYNSVMGLPFWVTVPEGSVCDISYQMGFVGQQTQCGYHLIRYGTERQIPETVEKGRKIIDFWVSRSMKESFLPQVWYNVFPAEFKKDYPTYLRTAADGMEGILEAYCFLDERGERHGEWLEFCERFAGRLQKLQNKDGSFARAYGKQGEMVHSGKFNTSNVIRFLTRLYFKTKKEMYKEIAQKAGEFCFHYIYEEMAYIGGTADNDNTIDKEAGMQALYAFMAMYDLTGEKRWIEAARGAADFCETWTYCWTFPVYAYKGNAVFDSVNQTGLSLIATGHSHCDVMMAYCPYDFYRLYLLTKDIHYLEFARLILYNTKQTTDWSGIHGHAYPGLVEESGEIALQYHNGLGRWLPWCTIAEIEAIVRLKEDFGTTTLRD